MKQKAWVCKPHSNLDFLICKMPAMQETWVQSLGWEDPLEKGEATHSSILAWEIPWMSMEKGNATPVFLPGEFK